MGRTACTEPQCLFKGALYLTNTAAIVDEMELMEFHLIHDSSRQQYWFDNT